MPARASARLQRRPHTGSTGSLRIAPPIGVIKYSDPEGDVKDNTDCPPVVEQWSFTTGRSLATRSEWWQTSFACSS